MAKRIILCFDGTWNEPENPKDDRINPTNVLKVVRGICPRDETNREQVVFYETGIGSGKQGLLEKAGKFMRGATGYGISDNIQSVYRFLANNYSKGDDVFVFGFSRGAYSARSLIGMIDCSGLLKKEDMEFVPQAYDYYRTSPEKRSASSHHSLITRLLDSRKPDIKFLGVWDTVGALGAPTPFLGKITKWLLVGFHNPTLSVHVENACQAVAIDERRGPFKPSLWVKDNGRTHVQQVWFAGAHSNVGGGYPDTGLSDLALEWMLKRASECGLVIDEEYFQEILKPEPAGVEVNSYSLGYRMMEMLRVPPHVRPIGSTGVGEMIHQSVIDRMTDTDLQYRPANLISESEDPDELIMETDDHLSMNVLGKNIPICQEREATRHPLDHVTGSLSIDGQPGSTCEVIDFSLSGGVKIKSDKKLHRGDIVTLESEVTGRQPVSLVWHNGECMGLKFAA